MYPTPISLIGQMPVIRVSLIELLWRSCNKDHLELDRFGECWKDPIDLPKQKTPRKVAGIFSPPITCISFTKNVPTFGFQDMSPSSCGGMATDGTLMA